jgi:hypothetical protein
MCGSTGIVKYRDSSTPLRSAPLRMTWVGQGFFDSAQDDGDGKRDVEEKV